MWELDSGERWALKNWCFWTVVLEKTLESPLDCKEIQPVHPKWDQSWVFIGRTDVEAETPILWLPDVKSWLIGKDPYAGRDWGQEKGDDRGWDVWMASLTQWTWIWVNSGNLWWTGRPGVLRFMGPQRLGHDWATELNWTLCVCVCVCVLVAHSCLTLCDPMDCSLSDSSIHWIIQARVLEWLAIPFYRRPSKPRNQTWVSQAGRFFNVWATWEAWCVIINNYTYNLKDFHDQQLMGKKENILI